MPSTRYTRGLGHLPGEIQLQICTQLCIHCCGRTNKPDRWDDGGQNQRTLLALSQTSRSFHRVAQPIAFHIFQQVPSNRHANAFVKFVRTLLERPDLAQQVKELRQHHYEPGGWSNEQDFNMLKATADRLGMGSVDDPDFESADEEDVSAGKFCMELLIALLPNLETLHLLFEDEGNYEQTTYTYLKRRLDKLGSGGTLKHLRRVILDTEENWGFFFSIPAVGVLHQVAPNLSELVIRHNKGLESMDVARRDLRPMFSGATQSLRTLRLEHCALSNDSLSTSFLDLLIRHAPKLEHFSYRSQLAYFGEGLSEHLTPENIIKHLGPVSGTLKTIDIDLTDHLDDDVTNHPNDDLGQLITRSTIAQFEKLEDLRLDEPALCRHQYEPQEQETLENTCLTDIIPPTLRALAMRLYSNGIWHDLKELIACSDEFPNLRKIIIYDVGQTDVKHNFEEFQKELQSKGSKQLELEIYYSIGY